LLHLLAELFDELLAAFVQGLLLLAQLFEGALDLGLRRGLLRVGLRVGLCMDLGPGAGEGCLEVSGLIEDELLEASEGAELRHGWDQGLLGLALALTGGLACLGWLGRPVPGVVPGVLAQGLDEQADKAFEGTELGDREGVGLALLEASDSELGGAVVAGVGLGENDEIAFAALLIERSHVRPQGRLGLTLGDEQGFLAAGQARG
jgi:hypothetical protein